MRIGVDVGGTNTDAVIMDGRSLVASHKAATSENVSDGIVDAVRAVLARSRTPADRVESVMIGTTQFTNAFVERRDLLEVAVFRIALPAARALPPMVDWPEDLHRAVGAHHYLIRGGYQCDGRVNTPFDAAAVRTAALDMKRKGLRAAAVLGLFSPVHSDLEERAREIILGEVPDAAVTLSARIGRIGLLERENAAIMNASLADLAGRVVSSFRAALTALSVDAPFFISQNDGTLMRADYVEQYPVLTFASGPTNSMRGAVYLSGLANAVVADTGGTTTDIGVLSGGFPRESSVTVDIGGVRTNFRMPDVIALGLGGGSLVARAGARVAIGPRSVGHRLERVARVFGGETLTATDIAVAAGYADIGDRERVAALDPALVSAAVEEIHRIVTEGVDRMKTNAEPVPLVLVGGGAVLIDRDIPGCSERVVPEHAGVANAIGACIAQVGGEVDRVFSYEQVGRDEALAQAKAEAVRLAVEAGAAGESVETVDVEEVPLAYIPGGAVRVRMKVAGELAMAPRGRTERRGE